MNDPRGLMKMSMMVIVMMLMVLTRPGEVSLLHDWLCNSRMSDVCPSQAVCFNPF